MKDFVGGQAVIEGVMMRRKNDVAVAVRKPDKTIVVEKIPYSSWSQRYRLFSTPFVRGSFILFETMFLGMKALTVSANHATDAVMVLAVIPVVVRTTGKFRMQST